MHTNFVCGLINAVKIMNITLFDKKKYQKSKHKSRQFSNIIRIYVFSVSGICFDQSTII